ncbi:DENTIN SIALOPHOSPHOPROTEIN-RELATED [Salix purpurea]|uniref:DENTIN SIALOPHOSPHOPROTEIN-RELATED n=1 Tax=Salix purpurea TaxID=77065 RepID=A0A9Q0PEQ9_SALPP|nr:DENTIN SIALOPHOSPHOPROTEIN-RELATED [Salix purpurea]KAJ6686878.1 DENTIN SIALOPHOSPHOPROTEIN-RELATED [Salix purpurea]KAJ6686879.1 DENTIN SIALOPHOSPHOPROTEIN-RELATED [Salix purpurea]
MYVQKKPADPRKLIVFFIIEVKKEESEISTRTRQTVLLLTMVFEIPEDDIRELQISLRKEAGLTSYNLEENDWLPDLASLNDSSIADIDPSPPYLRCKNCRGRLLRGVNSTICVFCGRQHNQDIPPDPIKFMSTFGSRWFLQSLHLDGSEIVGSIIEAKELNRRQSTSRKEFPLSELLDLEIRWPSESERPETSVADKTPAQNLRTLNLGGVDLNNFFGEPKVDSVPALSQEQLTLNKQMDATGGNAVHGHENLSLFENVQPSETIGGSDKDVSGDWSSGWEAEFQSASSGTQHRESKTSVPFVSSSSVDLSAHMDSVFGPAKDVSEGKTNENATSSASSSFKDDLWSIPGTGVAGQDVLFKLDINDEGGGRRGTSNNSSMMNVELIQDNQWQTTTTTSKSDENKTNDENDDSFDAWNDFTGSSVQMPSNNSVKQDMLPYVDQASEINLFGGSSISQDVDFGNISQPDFFSGALNNQNGSSEANVTQTETYVSDR